MNALQFQKRLLGIRENMMNFALTLTANKDDAEDLLQDTALKVLDNREKFIDNVNFRGWVMTIMRNIFINNYHKVVKAQTLVDQSIDLYNLDIENESGLDSPDGSYHIKEISKAIESLSKEVKAPLVMYLSGYKYNEIAQKMNLPLGTIKSRIFLARQRLQKRLKDYR